MKKEEETVDASCTIIETMVREEWGRVLAILAGRIGDLQLAEDVLQDAMITALEHWPHKGLPDNPIAWLLQAARNKAIDYFRRHENFKNKQTELLVLAELESYEEPQMDEQIPDERLRLIFTCCHTALAENVRVALTLRTLCGLTTAEIAHAFLVSEVTMAQRLVRAKRKIKAANIPYRVPPPELWSNRLASVLSVVYLIFNEGYSASSGEELIRADLCTEAIRLGKILLILIPDEQEVTGLLSLMLLHDSRRTARIDDKGCFVSLENQDRSLWDQEKITQGKQLLWQALVKGELGIYQIQAAISAVHAEAESFDSTDWQQISLLYGKLYQLQQSPVVKLNAIVALSFVEGVGVALAELEDLEVENKSLLQYQPFYAVKADLLRRLNRYPAAIDAYDRALILTDNLIEQRFLQQRITELKNKSSG